MKLKYGNLMESMTQYDCTFVTTNAAVKNNGELVMGRGFAKSIATQHPEVPRAAGRAIKKQQNMVADVEKRYGIQHVNYLSYGIIPDVYIERHEDYYTKSIGLFQVKYHWSQPADIDLVKKSVKQLADYARIFEYMDYAVNYPAIGNGRLAKQLIEPIINTLPDNVHVWQFSNK